MIVPNESEIGAEVNGMGLDVWIGLIRDIMCTHKHRGTHMYNVLPTQPLNSECTNARVGLVQETLSWYNDHSTFKTHSLGHSLLYKFGFEFKWTFR